MERNLKRIYIYLSESQCCTPETNKSLLTTIKIKFNSNNKASNDMRAYSYDESTTITQKDS